MALLDQATPKSSVTTLPVSWSLQLFSRMAMKGTLWDCADPSSVRWSRTSLSFTPSMLRTYRASTCCPSVQSVGSSASGTRCGFTSDCLARSGSILEMLFGFVHLSIPSTCMDSKRHLAPRYWRRSRADGQALPACLDRPSSGNLESISSAVFLSLHENHRCFCSLTHWLRL